MNKSELYDLAAGLALAALAYALWQHHKQAAAGQVAAPAPAFGTSDPTKPDVGFGYDPYDPGALIKLEDLLKGTVADTVTGQTAGDEVPTTAGLIGTATADYYGTTYAPTTAPYDPGALW